MTNTWQESRTSRLAAVAILGVLFTMLRLGVAGADRATEFRRVVRELGVVPSPDLFGASELPYSMRLDFEAGRLITAAR